MPQNSPNYPQLESNCSDSAAFSELKTSVSSEGSSHYSETCIPSAINPVEKNQKKNSKIQNKEQIENKNKKKKPKQEKASKKTAKQTGSKINGRAASRESESNSKTNSKICKKSTKKPKKSQINNHQSFVEASSEEIDLLDQVRKQITAIERQKIKLDNEIDIHMDDIELQIDVPNKMIKDLEKLEEREVQLEKEYVKLRKQFMKMKRKIRRIIISEIEYSQVAAPMFGTSNTPLVKSQTNALLKASVSSKAAQSDIDMTKWEVNEGEISLSSQSLGSGAFGSVYLGRMRGNEVAVKIMHSHFDEGSFNSFCKEVGIISSLRHPNVLLFMAVCTTPGNLMMVTELMTEGSVHEKLHSEGATPVSFKQRMKWALQTALGINWLHCCAPPFLHLDLKPANLLLDRNMCVKVADFGLSKIKIDDKARNEGYTGSPLYMAPEIFTGNTYDEKADVYSFAMVLWELVVQYQPYSDRHKFKFHELKEYVVDQKKRPNIPVDCPENIRILLQKCWHPNPEKRLSFSKILKDGVLDKIVLDAQFQGVKDPEFAMTMWKEKFGRQERVPWSEFMEAFMHAISVNYNPDEDDDNVLIQLFKAALVSEKEEVLDIDNFVKFLQWFGPLEPRSDKIFHNLYRVCELPCFHGEIPAIEAEHSITSLGKKRAYLIRFSTRDPGCYTITGQDKERIKHYRITPLSQGGFECNGNRYNSLEKLSQRVKKDFNFKIPCPGSKYYGIVEMDTKGITPLYPFIIKPQYNN